MAAVRHAPAAAAVDSCHCCSTLVKAAAVGVGKRREVPGLQLRWRRGNVPKVVVHQVDDQDASLRTSSTVAEAAASRRKADD